MRMPAKSKNVLQQFWSVQETGRVAGQAAGGGRGAEKANRQGVGALFSCFAPLFAPDWNSSIASFIWRLFCSVSGPLPVPGTTQRPKSCVTAVKDFYVLVWNRVIKASVRMLRHQAQELLPPWIADKFVLMLFRDLIQLFYADASQRLLDSLLPLFQEPQADRRTYRMAWVSVRLAAAGDCFEGLR